MSEKPTVLIADDHAELLESLSLTLELEGFHVLAVTNGRTAIETMESNKVDLVLADISMPGLNGYQLLERVRSDPSWVGIPFIFITARAMDSDVRYGKELGADDYLTKPIHPLDLIAAVRGKLRRARQIADQSNTLDLNSARKMRTNSDALGAIVLGRLRIEPIKYNVFVDNEPIMLSAREFALLKHLASQPGVVVSTDELVEVTHKFKAYDEEAGALIRPLIRSIRRKLGYPVGETGCIENIRGVGYRITEMI
ncbi:MAG: response regulator transcription factor [Caldilineales bacterium]|nr:response regulator transcription factor [Caldilineales bacterium]